MKVKNLNQVLMEENHKLRENAMNDMIEISQLTEEIEKLRLYGARIKEENRMMQSDMYLELKRKYYRLEKEHKNLQVEHSRLLFDMDAVIEHEVDVKCKKLKEELRMLKEGATLYREDNKKLRERIDVLYEFIERNDKLVDEVIDEEDLDKLNRYIYIDDDLVDRALESED